MIQIFKPHFSNKNINEIKRGLTSAFKSGWIGLGPKVKEFEEKWAEFVGSKYAVATNSCTSALDIAVRLVNLPNPVKVPAFTFISTALAPLNAGYNIEFVDIDENTLNCPYADIITHYGGNVSGEGVIHDMAHCGGSQHKGELSCWSFHAVKNLSCGDGGMITMNSKKLYEKAKALSWCGIDKSTWARSGKKYNWDYSIKEVGLKAHMNDITAIIGLAQLKDLVKNNKYRAKIAQLYNNYLPLEVKRPPESESWHLYTIRHPKRNKIIKALAKNGIATSVHYKPLYHYPIFESKKLSITEKVYKKILTLPIHLYLKEKDIKRICELTKEAIK